MREDRYQEIRRAIARNLSDEHAESPPCEKCLKQADRVLEAILSQGYALIAIDDMCAKGD